MVFPFKLTVRGRNGLRLYGQVAPSTLPNVGRKPRYRRAKISRTFGRYIFFQHLPHNTPLPFSTCIHLLSSMPLEHRMHVNTVSRYLPSPLALDSSDNLSFLLGKSEEPPPIAPDIVPPRRLTVPLEVGDSRCVGDVRERVGGFDERGRDAVTEVGDRILSTEGGDRTLSVDAGEPRSAATAMSRSFSMGARAWSSEYAEEEMEGLRFNRLGVETMRRSIISSSSESSLWA
jgi:hypothetical protein